MRARVRGSDEGGGEAQGQRRRTLGRRSYWAFSSSVLSYTFTAVSPADSAYPPNLEAVVEEYARIAPRIRPDCSSPVK